MNIIKPMGKSYKKSNNSCFVRQTKRKER